MPGRAPRRATLALSTLFVLALVWRRAEAYTSKRDERMEIRDHMRVREGKDEAGGRSRWDGSTGDDGFRSARPCALPAVYSAVMERRLSTDGRMVSPASADPFRGRWATCRTHAGRSAPDRSGCVPRAMGGLPRYSVQ